MITATLPSARCILHAKLCKEKGFDWFMAMFKMIWKELDAMHERVERLEKETVGLKRF